MDTLQDWCHSDPAAGIFGVEGGDEAQGRAAVVEATASVIKSSLSGALMLTFTLIHHLFMSLLQLSCPHPPLRPTWSIQKWLGTWHEVNVCVSGMLRDCVIFSCCCVICFFSPSFYCTNCFFFMVRDHSTLVLTQCFISEGCHPRTIDPRVWLCVVSFLVLLMYHVWLQPQQFVSSILIWIWEIWSQRVKLSSRLKQYFTSCGNGTMLTSTNVYFDNLTAIPTTQLSTVRQYTDSIFILIIFQVISFHFEHFLI